jgi:nitroreductase
MDLYESILTRRTIKDFRPDPVPDETLERVLTAGLWAQNHRLTQPWRFTILGAETHHRLAEIAAESQLALLAPDAAAPERQRVQADALKKIRSKPLVVGVSQYLGPPAQRQEDYGAIACAIQNIQLAAWGEGLGMQWSSGKLTQLPRTYELLSIRPDEEEIVGMLFFGYPASVPPAQARRPLSDVMRRLP